MRIALTAAALLAAATLVAVPAMAEVTCPPNPLNQGHEPWMKMPSTAVDLRTSPPASATNPLMQAPWQVLPSPGGAIGTEPVRVNPLTNRP